MNTPADRNDPLPTDDSVSTRILRVAREYFFRYGYGSSTMDDLAGSLGMSKKTLYLHFPSKEAIVERIMDHMGAMISSRLHAITADPRKTFVQKLCEVVETVGGALSNVSPVILRDLQRYAPRIYDKIEQIRQRNIPLYFTRLIELGVAQGMVRQDIDPKFAGEFWLHAIRGLIQPDVLEKTQLTPKQTLEKAIDLFFGGLLTPAGHDDYAKHLAHCQKHGGLA